MAKLTTHPPTPDRWQDFEVLFGARGACDGCWCMTPRLTHAEYERNRGEGNRRAMKAIVDGGGVPGILGFLGEKVVAWCSIGPRDHLPWLARSRIFQPVDEQPVWSIVCFFIDKNYRRQGLSGRMIQAACDFVGEEGAQCIEAYPVEPRKDPTPPPLAYTGLAAAFKRGASGRWRAVRKRGPSCGTTLNTLSRDCSGGPGIASERHRVTDRAAAYQRE